MTHEQAQGEFNAAIDAYSAVRQQLADARFCAVNGMGAANLPFLEMQAHTKYHAMVRAHQNLTALQPPPAPKPVIAPPQPAPIVPVVSAPTPKPVKPLAVRVPGPQPLIVPEAEKSERLRYLEDRCRDSEARVLLRYGLRP